MGDVHPHELKANLARELSRITFERWSKSLNRSTVESLNWRPVQRFNNSTIQRAKTIFCNSGFEAVEAALKTAILATGKRDIVAFEGAYHGTGYGSLNATHRGHFRAPFQSQLGEFGRFVPFPTRSADLPPIEQRLRRLLRRARVGAVLVEPIQGRGGINLPPPSFLPLLRRLCDEQHALLILDEIYTGFGRTGKWFACEHNGVVPDLICLGKALTGGFPLSACVGRADLMDAAWPQTTGEAIHTSTFLGHPVGCAMALAQIAEIRRRRLVERSARSGRVLLAELSKVQSPKSKVTCVARGAGLMAGLELRDADGAPATALALDVIKAMLHRGCLLLPEGEHANVISFTPPLTVTPAQLRNAVTVLGAVLGALTRP
jgi:4-aminobutyrate aminotransferase-like enzyme